MEQNFLSMHEYAVACPECGSRGRFFTPESVNATLSPQQRAGVLDRTLFVWECPECGTPLVVDAPFLYHDMRRRFLIRYCPQDADEAEFSDAVERAGIFEGSGYTLRAVESYEELIEKIVIFEHDLDDRVVELCKLALLEELREEQPQLKVRRVLIDAKGEEVVAAFIDEDGDVFALPLPDDLYNRLYDVCGDVCEEMTGGGFERVDEKWAADTARLAMEAQG